jgi:TatD DNase family protein
MFLDFHCHLQHNDFSKGIVKVVERMAEKNVFAVNTGFNIEGNEKTLAQKKQHPTRLYAAIGLSPHDAPKANLERELEFIENHASEIVAIGEIGLDFHYFKTRDEQKKQERAFLAQMELAEKLSKPVVVHSRNAEEKCIELMASFKTPGVLHFFLLPKLLSKAIDAGLYVSIPTIKSKDQKKLFSSVPLDRILLETDSPYGLIDSKERNEPANVLTSYERLAETRRMPLKELELMIFSNFRKITRQESV